MQSLNAAETLGKELVGKDMLTEFIDVHPRLSAVPPVTTFVLRKLVMVVVVVMIAGTSNDQLRSPGSLYVYIASALADGARAASTKETARMGAHNLSAEFI